jgi:hypothetical protein
VRIEPRVESGPRLYRGSVPSVTEILKLFEQSYLDAWKHRVGEQEVERVLRNAQVFGTRLHTAAELCAYGKFDQVDKDIKPYAAAVRDFLEKHVDTILGTEVELVSPKNLRFGGTLDLYCLLKTGGLAVVDYKTSKQLTREHGLQTAAYAMLCRERGWEVETRLVVRIKKDKPGEYYIRHFTDHERDEEAFTAMATVWWWKYASLMGKKLDGNG